MTEYSVEELKQKWHAARSLLADAQVAESLARIAYAKACAAEAERGAEAAGYAVGDVVRSADGTEWFYQGYSQSKWGGTPDLTLAKVKKDGNPSLKQIHSWTPITDFNIVKKAGQP